MNKRRNKVAKNCVGVDVLVYIMPTAFRNVSMCRTLVYLMRLQCYLPIHPFTHGKKTKQKPKEFIKQCLELYLWPTKLISIAGRWSYLMIVLHSILSKTRIRPI